MPDNKQDLIDQQLQDLNNDGVDRRGFLKCMKYSALDAEDRLAGAAGKLRSRARTYAFEQLALRSAGAVKEWCINTAAVDPFTKSILANSEDGKLYRWNLTSNTLTEKIKLSRGISEAYTPTVIGSDGTAYAINDAILDAIGTKAQNDASQP